MDELDAIKVTFFQECDEQLAALEAGLLSLEAGCGDGETVNAVFRAVHSVKGGAGAFGFEALVRYAHVFESLLDKVRAGAVAADATLLAVMLRAADLLSDHVAAARDGGAADAEATRAMSAELERLTVGDTAQAPAHPGPPAFVPAMVSLDLEDAPTFTPQFVALEDVAAPDRRTFKISFRPYSSLYASGNEPALLLRELETLGDCRAYMEPATPPAFLAMDPAVSWLTWSITLETFADEAAVRDVFDWVEHDCDLTIVEVHENGRVGPLDAFDISALLAGLNEPPPVEVVTPIAPAPAIAAPPLPAPTPAKPEPRPTAPVEAAQTIRVDPERIDRLINLVGELVINQAVIAQRIGNQAQRVSAEVTAGLEELEQLTREIQDSVMAIRAQPVRSVFQRMPRLARETAALTRKQVKLVMEGEGTEVDKTVVERLAEPITHMIRNAIDHGLERPEDRIAAGKPAEGLVRLAALHRGGRIVIEVSDDGAGINRERVKAKAVERRLIDPTQPLSDEEIDNLIFLPGFSTAEAISDVSGRGVGMDVVRQSIQAIGGRISITSRPGEGSTFTLSLPLTLAVLDGMVVEAAGQTLIVPLSHIVESLKPQRDDISQIGLHRRMLNIRGAYTPLIDIGQTLGYRDHQCDASEGVVLLVDGETGGRVAFVADAIRGQRQVVIKSLETHYRQVPGISGATILGDGSIALIVDVDTLIAIHRRGATPVADPLSFAAE